MVSLGIFSARIEKLNLTVGVVLAIATVGFVMLTVDSGNSVAYNQYFRVIYNYLLLNTTHVIFTFLIPFFSPTVNKWWKTSRVGIFSVNQFLLLVFTVSTTTFFLLLNSIPKAYEWNESRRLLFFIVFFFAQHHLLGQTFGLTRLYDFHRDQLKPPIKKVEKIRKWQKIAFKALFLVSTTGFIVAKVMKNSSLITIVSTVFCLLTVFLVIYLIHSSSEEHADYFTEKTLFLFRLLVFPLIAIGNMLAVRVIQIIHSLEYAAIVFMMISNSKRLDSSYQDKSRGFYFVGFFFVALFSLMGGASPDIFGGILAQKYPDSMIYFDVLFSVTMGITFCHYASDKLMFQFSKSSVRNHVQPLVINK